ncbi:hypothetical protein ACMXZD_00255 [Pasteurella multocida]
MNTLLFPSCRVAFAALIHDLGKFAQRAKLPISQEQLNAHKQLYPRLIHLQDCIVQMFHAQTLKQHDRQWQLPIEVGFQVCGVHADALINESVMPCCE